MPVLTRETMFQAVRVYEVVQNRLKFGDLELSLTSWRPGPLFEYIMTIAGKRFVSHQMISLYDLTHMTSPEAFGINMALAFEAEARKLAEQEGQARKAIDPGR